MAQAEERYAGLPEDEKDEARRFQEKLKAIPRIPVDGTLPLEESPDFLSGLQVISTPGHTPGHISFFAPSSGTLIASDAVVIEDGEFDLANPEFTLDTKEAIRSVRKIRDLNPNTIICYHGGVMQGDIARKLGRLIDRYSSFT